jgi:hypothetical protein
VSEQGWGEVLEPVQLRPEFIDEINALAALLDAGLVEMNHEQGCGCAVPDRFMAECVRRTMRPVSL